MKYQLSKFTPIDLINYMLKYFEKRLKDTLFMNKLNLMMTTNNIIIKILIKNILNVLLYSILI